MNLVLGNRCLPSNNVKRALGDLIVCIFFIARKPHLQFLGYALDPFDVPNDFLSLYLLDVALNVACECHNAVLNCDPDVCCVEAWLER